jgi:iron complex transport system substrate-binding protein
VVAEDPEVLIIMPCGFDLSRTIAEATLLPRLPGWKAIPAVRSGRVYAVDGNAYFNRSGPRMVDSLEILAHLVHPELFPAPADRAAYAAIR